MLNLSTPFGRARPKVLKSSQESVTPNKPNGPTQNVYPLLWRKPTGRKHKQWDGDGQLFVNATTGHCVAKDTDGGYIGKLGDSKLAFNGVFRCGGYECQLDGEPEAVIELNHPGSATPYSGASRPTSSAASSNRQVIHPHIKPLRVKVTPKMSTVIPKASKVPPKAIGPSAVKHPLSDDTNVVNQLKVRKIKSIGMVRRRGATAPLFDASKIDNALVMPRVPGGDIDVVVDPLLSHSLRPHQRDGVKFLYECVMGMRDYEVNGAILADDMGLGKTLQSLTLIWTLLKQTPFRGEKPVVSGKVLICCPVTLVSNWNHEIQKWLGSARGLNVLALDGKPIRDEKQFMRSFSTSNVYQILIVGYEKMHSLGKELENAQFDLVICDEGHRLKNATGKAFQTLENFDIKRRVVLTGTPIQNDLAEFFHIINFANPGLLGTFKEFQKNFIRPILRSREPKCNKNAAQFGREKSRELVELTKKFMLRRTNSELAALLPKRSDYILFAPPTKLQCELFKAVSQTKRFTSILQETKVTQDSLNLITTFRKIANSPSLLSEDKLFLDACKRNDTSFKSQLSRKVKSGKVILLMKLLALIYEQTDEKVVLVSNFTQVLDILEKTLDSMRFTYTRLDGSTPSKNRGGIVDRFNDASRDSCFVFLLSAKAGGCGLNLTGASRLILFDNEWNPSIDLQAMARVHRDGQKNPVKIYRFLTSGSIDEKIFQRQLVKTNLSDRFLDDSTSSKEDVFNYSDLRDIFTVDAVNCQTHDLLNCNCGGKGEIMEYASDGEEPDEESEDPTNMEFMSALNFSQQLQSSQEQMPHQKQMERCLRSYRHIDPKMKGITTDDKVVDDLIKDGAVSYVFGRY